MAPSAQSRLFGATSYNSLPWTLRFFPYSFQVLDVNVKLTNVIRNNTTEAWWNCGRTESWNIGECGVKGSAQVEYGMSTLTYIITMGLTWLSTRKPSLKVAPTIFAIFSSSDRNLWPMTLTFKHDVGSVKTNHHAKCLGQKSFNSNVIVWI